MALPEGDTVARAARRLDLALAGHQLTTLELRWGDLGGRELLPATTVSVGSRGKHILHRLDTGMTVHTHLRMEGSWHLTSTGRVTARELGNPQVRVLAQTRSWTAFGLRLGLVELWPTSEEESRLDYLGPDLLSSTWDLNAAMTNIRERPGRTPAEATIGAALLDQRNLAGIGTLWASEGLFLHSMNPWTAAHEIPAAQVGDLVMTIRRLMRQSVLSAVQSSTGSTVRGATTYVHGRVARACRRCGDQIRSAPIGAPPHGERTVAFCPTCQSAKGETPLKSARSKATRTARLRWS